MRLIFIQYTFCEKSTGWISVWCFLSKAKGQCIKYKSRYSKPKFFKDCFNAGSTSSGLWNSFHNLLVINNSLRFNLYFFSGGSLCWVPSQESLCFAKVEHLCKRFHSPKKLPTVSEEMPWSVPLITLLPEAPLQTPLKLLPQEVCWLLHKQEYQLVVQFCHKTQRNVKTKLP